MLNFSEKKGLFPDFWSWKPTKGVGLPVKVKFCNELVICRLNGAYKTKSVTIVAVMSTKLTGELVATNKTHFKTKQNVQELDEIHKYNATMGGAYSLSRVINPYNMQLKGRKWYRKLAECFIEISVCNTFILWKRNQQSKYRPTSLQTRHYSIALSCSI